MDRVKRMLWLIASSIIILLGVKTALQPGRAQSQSGVAAVVTLRVVDSYGKLLEYKVENFHTKDQPTVNLAAQFEGLTFKHAVQGKIYDFRLVPVTQEVEHPPVIQSIAVADSSTLAVFSVPKAVLVPDMDSPWPVTKLKIKPAPHGGDTWVNVRPAFIPDISGVDTSETAVINKDGTFNLHGTHGGLYIVTLYQGSRVPKLALVDIPQFAPREPIEVKLVEAQ